MSSPDDVRHLDERRREVMRLDVPRDLQDRVLGWYVREQAWGRPVREALRAVTGGRGPALRPRSSASAGEAAPWAPVVVPLTASSKRLSVQLARELTRDAAWVREHVLGDAATLSVRAADRVLKTWVEDGGVWPRLTSPASALALVTQPRVRRFLRHYWRRSGELWTPAVLMGALLQGTPVRPRVLPPLVAHPRAWDVQPIPGGRVLEAPPHRAFEVLIIDHEASHADMQALWRRMRPRGPGRPRRGEDDTQLRAIMATTASPVDWAAVAKQFNAGHGRRVSPEALRKRWSRLPT